MFADDLDDEPTRPDRWSRREETGAARTWLGLLVLRISAWLLGARHRDHAIVEAARRSDMRITEEIEVYGLDTEEDDISEIEARS